jgi:LysR family transcriptional regulator, low CO2-responsive transcriptional regulator
MSELLDSRQLRAFSILARTGSFTQTARELHLSQSAISHAIKALEEEVRCRLLDRIGKKVQLTQAGEQFLVHAEKILHTMSVAREQLEQLGRWGRGRLRIAVSTTACQYLLPTVLREFKESFPHCLVHIEPADTQDAVESLRAHRVDLALCMEPKRDPHFEFRQLFTDDLQFIVSPLHPWARSGHVIRDQIVRQNYIVYTKTSYMFEMIEEYFRREKLVLRTSIELGNIEAIKELVKIGLGVSILAPWVAKKELAEKSLAALPLGRRKLERHWGILHWRAQRLSLAEETFIGLCQSAAADL